MSSSAIAILGAGSGGQAAAAELSNKGFRVNLYDNDKVLINAILEKGGIEAKGQLQCFEKLNKITSNIKEAILGADIVMPVLPRFAHRCVAKDCLPYLDEKQILFLNPGSTGGALEFYKVIREGGKRIPISTTATLPYAARSKTPGVVNISLLVKTLFFATFPGKYTNQMVNRLKELYPAIEPLENTLEVSLNNGNPITHVAPTLLNSGRIEGGIPFFFYREGITPSICRVMQLCDEERLALCRTMGFREITTAERLFLLGYAQKRYSSMYDAYTKSDAFSEIEAPTTLNHRFITEDIPYGLVTFSSIGDILGVPTPNMNILVGLSSILIGTDFRQKGMTADELNLGKLSREKMKETLMEGY